MLAIFLTKKSKSFRPSAIRNSTRASAAMTTASRKASTSALSSSPESDFKASGILKRVEYQSAGSGRPSRAAISSICDLYAARRSMFICIGESVPTDSHNEFISTFPRSSRAAIRLRASSSTSLKHDGTRAIRSSCLEFKDLISTVTFLEEEVAMPRPKPVIDSIMEFAYIFVLICKFTNFSINKQTTKAVSRKETALYLNVLTYLI